MHINGIQSNQIKETYGIVNRVPEIIEGVSSLCSTTVFLNERSKMRNAKFKKLGKVIARFKFFKNVLVVLTVPYQIELKVFNLLLGVQ